MQRDRTDPDEPKPGIMKEQHKKGKNSSCKGIKKCWGSHKRWADRNIFLPQTRIRTDWGNTVFLSVYIKQNFESKYRLCNKELRPHALLCRSTVSQSRLRLCKDEISIYRATFQNRIILDKLAQNCISWKKTKQKNNPSGTIKCTFRYIKHSIQYI